MWPAAVRRQRLSSMIWWWSSARSSRQDQTRSAKPRSPSISQLHRALSLHVKRLSARVIALRQGTAGNTDRMCCTAVPGPEVEETAFYFLHQAQRDCLCSEPMPDPRRAEILPWPHHTLGLTKPLQGLERDGAPLHACPYEPLPLRHLSDFSPS